MIRLTFLVGTLILGGCSFQRADGYEIRQTEEFVTMAEPIVRRGDRFVWTFFDGDRSMPRRLEVQGWRSQPNRNVTSRGLVSVRVEGCGSTPVLAADEAELRPIRGEVRFAWITADGSPGAACDPERLRVWLWMNSVDEMPIVFREDLWVLSWGGGGRVVLERRAVTGEPGMAGPLGDGTP